MAKVKVPQKDGEIVFSFGDDNPKKYSVTDGVVTVNQADLEGFLARVEGSKLQTETRSGKE